MAMKRATTARATHQAKKRVTRKTSTKSKSRSMSAVGKDPKGGLTAAGRQFYKKT